MTIFVPRLESETAGELAAVVEEALIQFRGTHYRRVEPLLRDGVPVWSYNVVVCDEQEQFVARLPLPWGIDSFSVWYGERQVTLAGWKAPPDSHRP